MSAQASPAPSVASGIGRATTVVFAVAGGVAQANVNYLPSVIALIGADLLAGPRTVGLVSVAMQIGFALGTLAFVPLGDIVERRGLIVGLFAATAVALWCASCAANVPQLALAICAVGVATAAPQILQPFAVDLALPNERGYVLGIIQSGMIVGALSGRAAGGVIGEHAGWRPVFAFAAIVTAVATVTLVRAIPLRAVRIRLRYRDLLASMPAFVRSYPELRASMALGFVMYAVVMGFWTVLAFHVRDLGYGSDVVGYIGLVSIASAITASYVGRLTDRWGTLAIGTISLSVVTFSTLLLMGFGNTVTGLIVGMMIFAIGAQAMQISNLSRIFAISDDARSRLTTIYMFAQYLGGAYGSFASAWAFQEGGWTAACAVSLANFAFMAAVLLRLRRGRLNVR